MASQPVLRSIVAKMAQLSLESGEDLPPTLTADQSATAFLLAYTEQGGTLSSLCRTLGCSRFLLQRWIRGDKERQESYTRARALSADALVDEGGDLLDSATRDTIAVANARAGWRKWLASKYDPQTYGEGTQATTPSALHLHYHAALQGIVPPPLASPPVPLLAGSPPSIGSHAAMVERGYPTGSEDHPAGSGGEIVVETPLDHS